MASLSVDVVNVVGSIPGKSFSATGSRNSMKGTMTNTEKGTEEPKFTCDVQRGWGGGTLHTLYTISITSLQGSARLPFPGCENTAGKLRQNW